MSQSPPWQPDCWALHHCQPRGSERTSADVPRAPGSLRSSCSGPTTGRTHLAMHSPNASDHRALLKYLLKEPILTPDPPNQSPGWVGPGSIIFNSNRGICMVRKLGETQVQQKRFIGLESKGLMRFATSLMAMLVYFSVLKRRDGSQQYLRQPLKAIR